MTAVLENLDPKTLTIDANIRKDASLDPAFLASIKDHGVLQPIVAHRTETSAHVLYGQRRTLAAVEGNLPTVPVYVVESATEADRLVRQMVENDQRLGLSERDRAEAFHQLSLMGIPAAQIAKKTGTKKTTVETALKVRSNTAATEALDRGWTLEQSAVLEEFSDDETLVAELQLILDKEPGRFAHRVQYLRNVRITAALIAKATAEQEALGNTVVDGSGYANPANQDANALLRADGSPATAVEDANAVVLNVMYNGEVQVRPVVANFRDHGYTIIPGRGASVTEGQSGPMTDAQKKERRTVIENNKKWDAATEVRQAWITALLGRKTPPKDWARFTATTLANYSNSVAYAAAQKQELAANLVGVTDPDYRSYKELVDKPTTNPDTAVLAMMLAAHESALSRQSWRHPGPQDAYYLFVLKDWGYTASDVETIMTDHAMRDTNTDNRPETAP
ncbi:ParB N-terminal domain-containing protein [uncultured Arthrobacter sp.]|uniref:ParB/RepB/Spo0J family partition protein n=1 Tax=uncultured Arthrobacter sp. TaxID=114050 RepID=UPI00261A313D|nr:ParB N-terminal domain-containing protein [uncultured Arthrobacter sp.]